MRISDAGIEFIKREEAADGPELKAYQDQAGIWTIGYGSITYRNGKPVKKDDVISVAMAEELLACQIALKVDGVNKLINPYILSQNRFDALVDFAYNLGVEALAGSTLLKKVRKNQNDPSIKDEFLKWNKVKAGKTKTGKQLYKVSPGLAARRRREWQLYNTL